MSVLVSGASIAGLSAAYWLSAKGHEVTVIERAPELRRGGSPVDIRGDALGVADRMGVLAEVRANRVPSSARTAFTTWVDRDGEPVAVLPAEAATDSDEDVEISRDRLIDILHGAIGPDVEFVYQDWIDSAAEDETGVAVSFAGGGSRRFDYLVGADGVHSSVRKAFFGPEERFRRHLEVYFVILDVPPEYGTPYESRTFSTPGRLYCVSDFGDRTLGMLGFWSPEIEYDYRSLDEQRAIILDALGGETGWQVPRLLEAVAKAEDFYFDSICQVRMDGWSRGRTVLVGDAAHASSPLSGRGTSLAMLGACFLAEEIEKAPGEHAAAFASYERRLRPYVARAQDEVPATRDFMIPRTEEELAARNLRFPLPGTRV